MKALILTSTMLASLAASAVAMADSECTDPVADWQPREALREKLEQQGWQVQRIKVDDGCYEVRGVDKNGNTFEAEYAPASLRIQKLEIKFDGKGDATDYLDRDPAPGA
ncbi:PepSY domain-containing protein [Arenimonas alkanexedens]